MQRPTLFIGSSSEGLSIAYAIQENLEKDCDVYVWTQDVFKLGDSYLESLINELDKADFAILVLTEDDITISRNQESVSPRDNVLFELGLFMGRLGRNRSFFVYDKDKNIKIPSDLSGISGAAFSLQQSGNLQASLGATCNKIRNAVQKNGARAKINSTHLHAYHERLEFCNRITGYWWELMNPATPGSIELSFVKIEFDIDTQMLTLKGQTFSNTGQYWGVWESKYSGINCKEQKIFYHWEGSHPTKPGEPYEGAGFISFFESPEVFMEGSGIFSSINIIDLKSINKKSFLLIRSIAAEESIMQSRDKDKIAKLVCEKIKQLSI